MSTALPINPRKKQVRVARATRLNHRQPRNVEVFRANIRGALLTKLYNKQYNYWNSALRQLSEENALSQGRGSDGLHYAVFWKHKPYSWTTTPFAESVEKAYCLPLNPRIKEYATRMEEIAEELDELWEERYEADRFITNLFTFEAPPKRFAQILGATLYRVVEDNVSAWFADAPDNWSDNSEFGIRTFVEANQEIINKMNERVMLNIVSI